MIPRNIIDEIFQTAQIEEVIGDFVNLKKSGQNFKGLSPWVNEKTPSFFVSPSKQIFKDFSSGKGGNVVSFLMEHEQMSYPEALRFLAKRYNIEIPEEAPNPEQEESQKHRESLFKVSEFAANYYEKQLWESDKGKTIGLSYLKERGLKEETIKNFHLGYADPELNSFFLHATSEGYKEALLIESGLAKTRENVPEPYDAYRDRIVFPIHSISGRCLGFGARILSSNTKAPKYLNSPENEIYHKSRVLYGLFQGRSEIVKRDRCFLVEGYTDVISLHQAGIKNVVSSSGTSLTEEQIRLIKRYTPNVTILYDGDEAGIKASFRGIDLLLKEGLNVKVLLFPEGEDPDSYARSHTKDELTQFIENKSEDFVFFKARVLGKGNENDPQKRSEAIRDIVSSIALIPDHISRNVYVSECSKLLKIGEQTLVLEINKIRRRELGKQMKKHSDDGSKETIELLPDYFEYQEQEQIRKFDAYYQELDVLRIMLLYHDQHVQHEENEVPVPRMMISDIESDALGFDDDTNRQLFEEIKYQINENGSLRISDFVNHENELIRSLVVDFLSEAYELHKWNEKEIFVHGERLRLNKAVTNSLLAFKARKVDLMILEIQNHLSEKDISDAKVIALLRKKAKLDEVRKQIGAKLGRVIMH